MLWHVIKSFYLNFSFSGNMPKAVRLRTRPVWADKEKKLATRLAASDTDYGYTFGPLSDTDRNYVPLTTFRLYPMAFLPSHSHGGNNTQPGGGVEVLVKMSTTEYHVVLDADSMLNKNNVLTQMSRQCDGAVFLASGLSSRDWEFLVDEAMQPLLEEYAANPTGKQPVKYIGLQAQLLPQKLSNLAPSHVRYFFNATEGVLDGFGMPVENTNLCFDPSQMLGVQQIEYQASGLKGFLRFIEKPFAAGDGDAFFEYVICAVFSFLYGFSAPFNVTYFKKLPTLILEGIVISAEN